MEPKIINKDQFKIIGLKKRFKGEKHNFYNIWNEFMKHYNKVKSSGIDDGFYGINFPPDENDVQDYIAGIAVDNNFQNSSDILTEHIQPSSLYAVFDCTVGNIGETYMKIFSEWAKNSQYTVNNIPCYDYYPPNTVKPDDKVFLYIPIIKNR
jgi:predicted transcriptional regulator YdeE